MSSARITAIGSEPAFRFPEAHQLISRSGGIRSGGGLRRSREGDCQSRLAREGYLVPATRGRRTELVVAPLATAAIAELGGIIRALEGFAIQAVGHMSAGERAALVADLERVNADLVALYFKERLKLEGI